MVSVARQNLPHLFDGVNLRDRRSSLTPQQVWTQYRQACHERFTPKRWNDFKNDLEVFFNIGTPDNWWRVNLFDAGYNSTRPC